MFFYSSNNTYKLNFFFFFFLFIFLLFNIFNYYIYPKKNLIKSNKKLYNNNNLIWKW